MFLGISYLFEKYFQSQINSRIYFWLGHTWVLISMSFILAANTSIPLSTVLSIEVLTVLSIHTC